MKINFLVARPQIFTPMTRSAVVPQRLAKEDGVRIAKRGARGRILMKDKDHGALSGQQNRATSRTKVSSVHGY